MHDFEYRHGRLHCGDVPLDEIVARVGTPFYCYSLPRSTGTSGPSRSPWPGWTTRPALR